MLDENGLPYSISKSYLSEEERLIICNKKVKKSKVSIVFSAMACLASFIFLLFGFTDMNIDIPLELLFLAAIIFMIIGCIVSGILSTSAKSKVNRQQVLEGKSLRWVKAAVIMTYISLVICVLSFEICCLYLFLFSWIFI